MSITARDLFFVLRVRDEASNALAGVSKDLIRVGRSAQTASLRARAATMRQQASMLAASGATKEQTQQILLNATALEKQARQLERVRARQNAIAQAMQSVGKAMALAGVAAVGFGLTTLSALYSTVNANIEYQRQVALTKTQVDGFSASLEQLGKIGIDTANNIAVPFAEIQPALYDIFSSTDANLAQAQVLLTAFAKAAVAGQVSIQDSSRATMGIMNAYKIPFQEVNQVLDVQFQLVRKGVGTYGQFANVIGRAVPSAVKYNQSIQTLAGSLAFLTRNGLSPAMAAASAARAMDALDNPNAVANLKAMGIQVFNAAGQFLPMTQVLEQLRAKIMALPPQKRVEALFGTFKGAGGTIQAMRFLNQVIIKPGQLEALEAFITSMQKATGQFGAAYGQMAGTAAAQTQLLKNKWSTLKVTIGAALTPSLIILVGWLNKLLTLFEKLNPKTQKIIILGAALAAAFTLAAGAVLIIAGGFTTMMGILGTLTGEWGLLLVAIAAVIIALYKIGKAVANAIRSGKPLFGWFESLRGAANHLRDTVVGVWEAIVKAYDKWVKPALVAAGKVWHDIWQAIGGYVKDAFKIISDKIGEGLRIFGNFIQEGLMFAGWVIKTYLVPALKSISDWMKTHKDTVHAVLTAIGFALKIILIVAGSLIALWIGEFVVTVVIVVRILEFLIKVLGWIVDGIRAIVGAVKWFINWLDHAGDHVQSWMATALYWFEHFPSKLQSFFADAGTWLYNAGKAAITGFINGLKNKFGDLGKTLSSIGKFVVQNKGPKAKDLAMLVPAGQNVMKGFVRGISMQKKDLMRALNGVSMTVQRGAIQAPRVALQPRATVGAANSQPTKTITNHITVHTQEISPRRHAAELGFELGNRM